MVEYCTLTFGYVMKEILCCYTIIQLYCDGQTNFSVKSPSCELWFVERCVQSRCFGL